MLKITLLGTGSPEVNARRASSGYLIEYGDDVILMDCGGGVVDRLVQAGYKPSDITHLFFTHLHSDHMMDYARLLHAAWDEGGQPVKVFGPAPVGEITEKLFGINGVFSTDLIARTENQCSQEVWLARGGALPRPWPSPVVTEIEADFQYSGDHWSLSCCEVEHAQPQLASVAYRLDAGGKSFVYSGDAALSDKFESFAADCDVLLHWCYRQLGDTSMPSVAAMSPDPREIAVLAARCGAKQLLITHLRVQMDSQTEHEKIHQAVNEHFQGQFRIAEDLLTITL